MAMHSSILARIIPWTEEPGRLQYMGFQRVGRTEHSHVQWDENIKRKRQSYHHWRLHDARNLRESAEGLLKLTKPITKYIWSLNNPALNCMGPLTCVNFFYSKYHRTWSFPHGSDGKSICLQCRRHRFDPWVGKILWRRKWQPIPILLPGKFHGWRSLVGYSPWDCKESDTIEQLHFTSPQNYMISIDWVCQWGTLDTKKPVMWGPTMN